VADGAATVYAVKVVTGTQDALSQTFVPVSTKKSAENKEAVKATKPISILLMGIDTGAVGRTDKWTGRSDSMMVVTINPEKEKTTIVSLDRDSLVKMVGDDTNPENGIEDKLNHAYAYGGATMAMNTIDNLLDTNINYYAAINMQGLSDLIDAVGGIEVNNKMGEFDVDDGPSGKVTVPAGKQTMNGEVGLAYARMRKQDPEGDVGRQKRQREVVTLIVKKLLSVDGISNYEKVLNAVKANLKTNLTWSDMQDIALGYRSSFKNVEQFQLQGVSQMINEVYYQLLPKDSLLSTINKLHEQLGEGVIEALPQGSITYESKMGVTAPATGTTTSVPDQSDETGAISHNTGAQTGTGVVNNTGTDQGYYSEPAADDSVSDGTVSSDYPTTDSTGSYDDSTSSSDSSVEQVVVPEQ
jgi:LCP family protein required for cell wall assembly